MRIRKGSTLGGGSGRCQASDHGRSGADGGTRGSAFASAFFQIPRVRIFRTRVARAMPIAFAAALRLPENSASTADT